MQQQGASLPLAGLPDETAEELGSAQPHGDAAYVRKLTVEACARHYDVAYPHAEQETGRPLRVSPLYGRLDAAGAVFGAKLGWERANWFGRDGEPRRDEPSFGRPNWFDAVAREHRACRETAALYDQSSYAKYLATGRDAEGRLRAAGGRVLGVTALGADAGEAQRRAYAAVDRIDWPEGFCRRDIGHPAVARAGS